MNHEIPMISYEGRTFVIRTSSLKLRRYPRSVAATLAVLPSMSVAPLPPFLRHSAFGFRHFLHSSFVIRHFDHAC
jgi:hypothetical protein